MQYLLTEDEMSKYVKKSDLEHSEKIRDMLFNLCQPSNCIHLPNHEHHVCDGCPLSSLRSGYSLCHLDQHYSK